MIKYILSLILISNYVFAESTTERKMLTSKEDAYKNAQSATKYWKCTDNTGISIYSKIPCDELIKAEKKAREIDQSNLAELRDLDVVNRSSNKKTEQIKEQKCQEMRTSHVVNPTPETRKYIRENCQ